MAESNVKVRDEDSGAVRAGFIEPMLCLAVDKLPEGPGWQYELKLDAYALRPVIRRSMVRSICNQDIRLRRPRLRPR